MLSNVGLAVSLVLIFCLAWFRLVTMPEWFMKTPRLHTFFLVGWALAARFYPLYIEIVKS